MKASRYNHSTTLPDGTSLVFNFVSLALLSLHPREAEPVTAILKSPEHPPKGKTDSEWYRVLVEQGFLVEDDVGELARLKKAHSKSKASRQNVGLTIAPSLACNFACVYCYQRGHHTRMEPEVEHALEAFTRDKVQTEGSLSVTWFGGEPLLQIVNIDRLSRALIQVCNDKGTKYSATVITNGYLLDGATARRLSKLGIADAQVTLDGSRSVHDQRRVLKNGGETFQRIMKNLREASQEMPISLRMNVDDKNRDDISELIDILAKEGLEKRVHLYLGKTYPYTAACSDVSGWCLTDEDFALLRLETALNFLDRGFVSFRMPKRRNYYCLADSESCYVVTPSGGLAKCWNEVDDPGAEVGHLLKPSSEAMTDNQERWRSRSLFELECGECRLLPICMGGCPYLHRITGRLHCHEWKHHLDEYLAYYHYVKQFQRQNEVIRRFQESVESVKDLASAASENTGANVSSE